MKHKLFTLSAIASMATLLSSCELVLDALIAWDWDDDEYHHHHRHHTPPPKPAPPHHHDSKPEHSHHSERPHHSSAAPDKPSRVDNKHKAPRPRKRPVTATRRPR